MLPIYNPVVNRLSRRGVPTTQNRGPEGSGRPGTARSATACSIYRRSTQRIATSNLGRDLGGPGQIFCRLLRSYEAGAGRSPIKRQPSLKAPATKSSGGRDARNRKSDKIDLQESPTMRKAVPKVRRKALHLWASAHLGLGRSLLEIDFGRLPAPGILATQGLGCKCPRTRLEWPSPHC